MIFVTEIDFNDDIEIVFKKDIDIKKDDFIKIFWSKVNKKGEDECWIWKGIVDNNLYGIFNYNGITYKVHRLIYEITYGKFSDSLFILHNCDNPSCVNPKHLRLGTHIDNMNDMSIRGRIGFGHGEKVLDGNMILFIHEMFYKGKTKSEIANELGYNKRQIDSVFNMKQLAQFK